MLSVCNMIVLSVQLLTVTREVKSSGVPQKAAVISGDTARKTAAEKTAPRGRDVEILTESSHTLPDDSIAAKVSLRRFSLLEAAALVVDYSYLFPYRSSPFFVL